MTYLQHTRRGMAAAILISVAAFTASFLAPSLDAAEPETVIVTLHAKPGTEAELERVLARHWDTLRRLDLVHEAPHVTLRGTEGEDRTYFVEILTWRDVGIPDKAPAEVLSIWTEMRRLVEPRAGQSGLHIAEVAMLAPPADRR